MLIALAFGPALAGRRAPQPRPRFPISDAAVVEGNDVTTLAQFKIELSASSTDVVKVHVVTTDDSAAAPDDFRFISVDLTFDTGQTSIPFSVVVNGDHDFEPDERFLVDLTRPTNATIATRLPRTARPWRRTDPQRRRLPEGTPSPTPRWTKATPA